MTCPCPCSSDNQKLVARQGGGTARSEQLAGRRVAMVALQPDDGARPNVLTLVHAGPLKAVKPAAVGFGS